MTEPTEFLSANEPPEVDADRLLFGRRVGRSWALRYASLRQIQSLIALVEKDPGAFVNRFRDDKSTLFSGKLFEVVAGWRGNDEDRVEFWNIAFRPGEIDNPKMAAVFLEGALEAWKEVWNTTPR